MYIHAVHADLADTSLTLAPGTRVSSEATRTVPAVGVWFDAISSEYDMIYESMLTAMKGTVGTTGIWGSADSEDMQNAHCRPSGHYMYSCQMRIP